MSPSDYGIVALYQVLLTFLGAVFGFSVNGFCNIKYFELQESSDKLKIYIANSIALLIVMALIMNVFIISYYIFGQSLYDLNFSTLILLSVAFFSQYIIYIRLGIYQVKNQSGSYCLINILNASMNILLTILLVVFINLGYLGRIYGIVFSLLFIAIISLYRLYKDELIVFKLDTVILKEIARYGLSYSPIIIFVALIPLLERSIIAIFLGADSTGIFMVANQISNGFLIILSSFITAYTPVVYRRLSVEKTSSELKRGLAIEMIAFLLFVIISYFLLSTEILGYLLNMLLPESYSESIPLAKLMILSVVLRIGVMILSIYLVYMKLNLRLSLVNIVFGGGYIIALYFQIEENGLMWVGYLSIAVKILTIFVILAMVVHLISSISKSLKDGDRTVLK
jgi:O-antigen/teichoic acid export membrane protein